MAFVLKPWQLILMALAGWINQQQQEVIEYLRTENQVLKETHGKKRILLNDDQRDELPVVQGRIRQRRGCYAAKAQDSENDLHDRSPCHGRGHGEAGNTERRLLFAQGAAMMNEADDAPCEAGAASTAGGPVSATGIVLCSHCATERSPCQDGSLPLRLPLATAGLAGSRDVSKSGAHGRAPLREAMPQCRWRWAGCLVP